MLSKEDMLEIISYSKIHEIIILIGYRNRISAGTELYEATAPGARWTCSLRKDASALGLLRAILTIYAAIRDLPYAYKLQHFKC